MGVVTLIISVMSLATAMIAYKMSRIHDGEMYEWMRERIERKEREARRKLTR